MPIVLQAKLCPKISLEHDTWLLIKSVIQPNTPHIVRKTGNGGDARDIEQNTEQDIVVHLVTTLILKDHAATKVTRQGDFIRVKKPI
uniref:Uncharacterized protein n=1 Tax=Magallana gigas TaxID=29159 RepID=K1QII4_MAGGI